MPAFGGGGALLAQDSRVFRPRRRVPDVARPPVGRRSGTRRREGRTQNRKGETEGEGEGTGEGGLVFPLLPLQLP